MIYFIGKRKREINMKRKREIKTQREGKTLCKLYCVHIALKLSYTWMFISSVKSSLINLMVSLLHVSFSIAKSC